VLASAPSSGDRCARCSRTEIKKRLAFSTVSQVSYIVLGAALVGPFAVIGGLAHLVHQGLMKITLFFCAGIYDERNGVKRIEGLNGLGPRMPDLGLLQPRRAGDDRPAAAAGFVSKIYLGSARCSPARPG
jgi:multicomponent Na+:H+ antiporter subunit D